MGSIFYISLTPSSFILVSLPGQWFGSQVTVFDEDPSHSLPPFCDFRFFLLVFVFSIFLQVHRDQNVHSPHLQSTGNSSRK